MKFMPSIMPEMSVSVGFAERLPVMISHTRPLTSARAGRRVARAGAKKAVYRRARALLPSSHRQTPTTAPREERAVIGSTAYNERRVDMFRHSPGAVPPQRLSRAADAC
ncbi:hypothetical protein FEK33_23305 [Nocardia asteroides NBRC 15531]|uniref:Uncharacterized protein n=1 Tax=Nocardia asteroides NBRC 15531 TaxID=1110697 RepID=U5E6V0_NOCAS|nr:hypothetical protein [Nocardia asteroides]TLF64543.1 hypothetical protein FEK33_23305 [Nocardia asteroides NBRC 15531]UGT50345.1 hypothetical protein LT345_07145 [Nocardia asteroides]GAD82078.1 hypothetical protein NCAST_05_05160 [Nocardia asteroides NBRC 15531]